ncbi:hypothetical protein DFR52_1011222 [Hoeflea marina]|uniref:Extensin-like C-terminal domain-containing protein n=1 Tax=Hoeflea marina TaxID=274592 RepID=A0A317PSS8_9HYPH|nr:extensin family protein [Hoeflea marina]PWW04523.1 hypothetical protein DFR52_1011222 [Hoeflea marina]
MARHPSSRPHLLKLSSLMAISLVLGSCSGSDVLAPPGELLSLERANPVIAPEPQPAFSYPVAVPMQSSGGGNLAEGQVAQPVVTGIGTDSPQLAGAAPDPVVITEPVDATPEAQKVGFLPRFSNPAQTPAWAGGMPAAEKACRQRLKRLGVRFRDIPAINPGRSCNIDYPIELTALSGGIEIKPAAKLNCQITEAFAQWVKNELAPSVRVRYVAGISSINQLSSYSCRTMNSVKGAAMSEHSHGNAIDVGKITLNSGTSISVRKPGFFAFREKNLLNTVRADSCKYFSTVLGPGSDVHHKDHFHFDLRQRKSGYRHCSL